MGIENENGSVGTYLGRCLEERHCGGGRGVALRRRRHTRLVSRLSGVV